MPRRARRAGAGTNARKSAVDRVPAGRREKAEARQIEKEVSAVNAAAGKKWHLLTKEDAFSVFDSSAAGISQGEALARLREKGPNVIEEAGRVSAFSLLLDQFRSLLVIILIIATFISAALGEILDAGIILIIVILNAFLGFTQEWKAERSLEALKRLAAPRAKVIRDGMVSVISSTELVPGDVILLEEGDRVPADCRIVEQLNLKIDESALTGESTPVAKSERVLKADAPVAERQNMAFSGTTVVYGHCKALVVATGMETEFGRIAKSLATEEEPTPMQIKMNALGKELGKITLAVAAIIFIAGYLAGAGPVLMFLTAVSLAVAAIPEGLPAIVTISLARGVQKMAARNAIVRRLAAVESLGAATVICSDKTGTMTKNEMTVRRLYVDGKDIEVTGEGYSGRGKFYWEGKEIDATRLDDVKLLLGAGMLCNDAMADGGIVGDPTEAALIVSAKKAGIPDLRKEYPRLEEIPFDSRRKMMSVSVSIGSRKVTYSKGALEAVLEKCTHVLRGGKVQKLTSEDRENILAINRAYASKALRVLAFAVKKTAKDVKLTESGLTFIGLQGMSDPPRPETKDAIARCRLAGIKVVMITGDHRDTAVAIAKELGMLSEDPGAVATGQDLDRMSDDQLESSAEKIEVYARVTPEHKVRIAEALKKRGHIVAMTGDGINDAPALKKADIGVAMGISGTDVAREASDIILTDDNFSTIVAAVEEGRGIFDNVLKFIRYLLSCNMGEVLAIFAAMMASLALQNAAFLLLIPAQILWMNLVTDGLPALALGAEPHERGIMARKPRDPAEPILGRKNLLYILGVAVMMAFGAVGLFFLNAGTAAQTVAFTSLVFYQMAVAYSARSNDPLWKVGWTTNGKLLLAIASSIVLQLLIIFLPPLNPAFKTVPLSGMQWLEIVATSLAIFAVLETAKVLGRRRAEKPKLRVDVEGFDSA